MSNEKKSKAQPSQNFKPEKKQKTGYISWWLFRKKGTVAEDWPTAEELWNDPEVQSEIEEVRQAFNHKNTKQNN